MKKWMGKKLLVMLGVCSLTATLNVTAFAQDFTQKEDSIQYFSNEDEAVTQGDLRYTYISKMGIGWTDVNKVDRKKCERIKNLS